MADNCLPVQDALGAMRDADVGDAIVADRERRFGFFRRLGGFAIGTWEVCGNDYDRSFSVTTSDGQHREFDSFSSAP
jgi:hypothetical protein